MNDNDAYQKAMEADTKATVALTRIADHEMVCEKRYRGIDDKLDIILGRQWNMAKSLIVILLSIVGFFLARHFGVM